MHFQSLAFETYDSIFKDDLDPPKFSCSSSFIQDFKKRNKISSRLAHFRQRPVDISKEKIQLDIDIFKSQVISIIPNIKSTDEPVINCDETGFQILPTSIRT